MAFSIKICGLSTPETLKAALDAGADMVGFVFFAASPRHVDLTRAAQLTQQARGRAETVVLSVDAGAETIAAIMAQVKPDWLQLHGHETPDDILAIKRAHGVPVMKALAVSSRDDLDAVAPYAAVADRILFDARPPKHATRPGGLGVPFDWHLLDGLTCAVPVMVSGGLSADNVADAVRITRASGVDTSSGVEIAPGVKSIDKIEAFVRAARNAARTTMKVAD